MSEWASGRNGTNECAREERESERMTRRETETEKAKERKKEREREREMTHAFAVASRTSSNGSCESCKTGSTARSISLSAMKSRRSFTLSSERVSIWKYKTSVSRTCGIAWCGGTGAIATLSGMQYAITMLSGVQFGCRRVCVRLPVCLLRGHHSCWCGRWRMRWDGMGR